METLDEIVVLYHFDDSISASIAKTKLDAYGIPCFLTQEHLSNLYPGQNILSFKVRLHVFEKDKEQARLILSEANMSLESFETTCPRCHAKSIDRAFPKRLSESFFGGLQLLFFGVFFPQKKVNHCLECDNEF